MKYSMSSLETDEKVAEVERNGNDVSVKLSMEKEVSVLKNVRVQTGAKKFEVEHDVGTTNVRVVFPYATGAKKGQISIATSLGSMNFIVSRGAVDESAGGANATHKTLKSSMPGKVLKVICKVGDRVEAGQTLLVIEAMKMENEIKSPISGVIEKIAAVEGNKVETGEMLLLIGKGE